VCRRLAGRGPGSTALRGQPWPWVDAAVEAFVKNAGLGFAIPYLYNGQMHDYMPDFIVRLKTSPAVHLILETKGFDEREEVKRAAAERWVAAVNADGTYGRWAYALAKKPAEVPELIKVAANQASCIKKSCNTD